MTFSFNVNKKRISFRWWQMLIFILLFLGFLILLFPKKLFLNTLLKNTQPNEISISFLKNMLEKEPTNSDIRLVLAGQQFRLGKIEDAKKTILPYLSLTPTTDFQWKILLLYFQITRVEAFALKETDPRRHEKEATLKSLLSILVKSPKLSPEEQADLADDALALNLPMEADTLYKMAIERGVKKPASFFAKAGMSALFIKDYEGSAKAYLIAMQKSVPINDKRIYFIKAMDSLNAEGAAKHALDVAEENIDGLKEDKATLIYLAKLALMAGQPKVAQTYVSQVLQLQYRDIPE